MSRHSIDDFPLQLFELETDAIEFAEQVDRTWIDKIGDIFGIDPAELYYVSVVKFDRVSGSGNGNAAYVLKSFEHIRDFTFDESGPRVNPV